ncbi:hypothetical protein [Actinoplanes sp. NPDC051859]|uniref:hypothetical protein n=1 Tax=Actinoplanes sp. NPDC051859 TaxID=3363909 RepID=UPI0037B87232
MTPPPSTGWTWALTVAVVVPFITVSGSILVAGLVNRFNTRKARLDDKAKSFAEALTTIEEYAEMPYRIRRRPNTENARHEVSADFGKIKARIQFHLAWLQIQAPDVHEAYKLLDEAARGQAGRQAREAWLQPPLTTDEQMNLGVSYPRDEIDRARNRCLAAMLRSLNREKDARKLPISGPVPRDRSGLGE